MKYVPDTSVLIEKLISDLVKKKKLTGTILIPHAVVSELEAQANRGLEIGFLGLEEIQNLRKLKVLKVDFIGNRPTEQQIKFAKAGEIDALIRELAYKEKATLITADLVQAESAKAFGIKVKYFKLREVKEILSFEKYKISLTFANNNYSIYFENNSLTNLKQNYYYYLYFFNY